MNVIRTIEMAIINFFAQINDVVMNAMDSVECYSESIFSSLWDITKKSIGLIWTVLWYAVLISWLIYHPVSFIVVHFVGYLLLAVCRKN